MKKSLITLTIILAVAAMVIVFCGPAMAKVRGRCDSCHTMHNSQGGSPMAKQLNAGHTAYEDDTTANGTLLVKDCVGCHSYIGTDTTYMLGGCLVPVVYSTSDPSFSTTLAGGNFYWVADKGGNDDAKGHNVLGISTEDLAITAAEGAPGNAYCGGAGSCHGTLAAASTAGITGPGGCQGCHLDVQHHANDGTGTKYVGTAPDKWYRFLVGHMAGPPTGDYGVEGIEDRDWQKSKGENDHNEYKGLSGVGSGSLGDGDGTMTAFCSGCHGKFHSYQGAVGEWIRHPSDFVIPDTAGSEYASMSSTYNPNVPVARPSGFTGFTAGHHDLGDPSGTVAAGTDMVMCLSCHVAHGSPYDDLLRWDYADMVAGDSSKSGGCFVCHTKKDTGG